MKAESVLTVSAGLAVLQQLDPSGAGTAIERPDRWEEAEVGASSIVQGARSIHCCHERKKNKKKKIQLPSSYSLKTALYPQHDPQEIIHVFQMTALTSDTKG